MKKSILVDVVTFFFVLLFLYTGCAKLMEISTFKEQLSSSPFLGAFAGIITWGLPIGEILLAIALLIPATRIKALYASMILMAIFTVYVIVILFIDNQLNCSCGGIIEELSPKQHVLFNSACVILSLIAIMIARRRSSDSRLQWAVGTSSVGLFLLIGWMLFTAFTAPATEKTGKEGSILPSFVMQLPDSTTQFNTMSIPSGAPFVVIGFSPWCTHCQAETADIIKEMNSLKDFHIYYVTPSSFKEMKTFYLYFKLQLYPNITMGRDSKNSFFSFFQTSSVPYTTIYDAQKRLKKVFLSQAKPSEIIKALKE